MSEISIYQNTQSKAETFSTISPISFHIQHLPLKRIFDICFSTSVLFFGLPLYILIGFMVYFSSPGKIIYFHKRIGRGGKTFNCYKFRTMYSDADIRLQELLKTNEAMREEWLQNYKFKNDPRITPIGAFLRRTSLDELPQFWNVLKGDLSVVGPRPVVKDELIQHYGVKAAKILSIRPGLTGLWQISGRNDTSYTVRVSLDEQYADTQSLLLDLKIILKTIPAMIVSRGAY